MAIARDADTKVPGAEAEGTVCPDEAVQPKMAHATIPYAPMNVSSSCSSNDRL